MSDHTVAPEIIVASYEQAPRAARERKARYMLSVIDPHMRVATPAGIDPANHLILAFEDITHPPGLVPQAEHIAAALSFSKKWAGDGPIVVHCMAGVSRSSATALALLSQRSPGHEGEAAAAMQRQRYFTRPNQRILALADEVLGREGALSAVGKDWRSALPLAEAGLPYLCLGADPPYGE